MSVIERALNRMRSGRVASTDAPERIGKVSNPGSSHQLSASSAKTSWEPKVFIDRAALRGAGYLPDTNQDRIFADEYRQIKRPLIATAFGTRDPALTRDPRLIVMASALPGDGKTFTSINLAFSIARERDTSVVLVDADTAKPHVSQIFGVEKERGLLDALADRALPMEPLVLPTDVPGLYILPAGSRVDSATELLASERMGIVAHELLAQDPRRLVLFDSSPLLVASESRALADIAGQVVLVVRAGKTPRRAVLDALAEIGDGKELSLVLNQGRRHLLGSGYGYGSYGDYGNDHAQGAT